MLGFHLVPDSQKLLERIAYPVQQGGQGQQVNTTWLPLGLSGALVLRPRPMKG